MARYTGPKHKLARREGINLLEKTSASLQRRLNVPPGVHGKKGKRRVSEYGQQLREKQRAKVTYGMLERQFKTLVEKVSRQKGDTEDLLIAALETRLDNVVYRLKFAKSRMMARQFVSHGHVLVNEKKMTIPSYQVQEGDVISIDGKIQKNPDVMKLLAEKEEMVAYLDKKGVVGKLKRLPATADVAVPFNTRQIIEYYSR
jgi:small subunit ribosomal protein S4